MMLRTINAWIMCILSGMPYSFSVYRWGAAGSIKEVFNGKAEVELTSDGRGFVACDGKYRFYYEVTDEYCTSGFGDDFMPGDHGTDIELTCTLVH